MTIKYIFVWSDCNHINTYNYHDRISTHIITNLRGQKNARYHEKILSNKKKSYNINFYSNST